MEKISTTTKDVGLIRQLLQNEQLRLAPEFQRNAVWPRAAKAYLIDTILSERPMPLFFFQRSRSLQTGNTTYTVVDGQQRLRAIFEFIDDRFALTESQNRRWKGRKFSELSADLQKNVMNYDLTVAELTNYDEIKIRDIFARMNKYVVKLSPQELRHAKGSGRFHEFVETLGRLPFWRDERVFTKHQVARMRATELAGELTILLLEGAQDKKASLDLYYVQYRSRLPFSSDIVSRLQEYFKWIKVALPGFGNSRYRKPTDLYGLIGALDIVSRSGKRLRTIDPKKSGVVLSRFEDEMTKRRPSRKAVAYLAAASQQTDNIGPRSDRIGILSSLLVTN
jgi:hypothetical protein